MAKLNITELDFENSKQQLKNYLKGQTRYKDYDFDGSNLSVLMDVLSYNTYQNNFYTNMAMNEMFIDSAVLRNSVISHAKELNYLPRSRTSARAIVNVTINDDTVIGQTITIEENAAFTTSYLGVNYEFVSDKAYVARKTAPGVFVAENVEIFEGQMLTSFEREGYFVDVDGTLRVILSNENADTESLSVFVDAEASDDANQYIRKNNIFGVGPLDKVFYVEPYYDGRYTIYFGNNKFGKQPTETQDIRVKYRICSGSEANGASLFSINVTNTGTTTVTTVAPATGGAEQESIESIRYFAPKSIQIQERAITASDYEILLKQRFPEIQAVAAYGGDELNPPQFGRVAISIYLGQGEDQLSSTLSNTYVDYLKDKTPLAVEPVFVATNYLYSNVTVNAYYNAKITRKSVGELETIIRNIISNHVIVNLDDFNKRLRLSMLSSEIDAGDISILSNKVTACPYIEYSPALNVSENPVFKFEAEIIKPYPFKLATGFKDYKPSIISGTFSYDSVGVYLQDDGAGKIQMITSDVNNPQVVIPNLGTVNYTTGEIKLIGFKTDGYTGSAIKIIAETKRNDIKAPKGRLFTIRDTDVTVNIIDESSTATTVAAGTTTSSSSSSSSSSGSSGY